MSIENINWDKTGGPAFPATFDDCSNDVYIHGMSLRDWFAGQALAGLIGKLGSDKEWHLVGDYCYHAADKLIAARNQAKGEQP
jgi:hypothetical protein